jgi:hypothetical protein
MIQEYDNTVTVQTGCQLDIIAGAGKMSLKTSSGD